MTNTLANSLLQFGLLALLATWLLMITVRTSLWLGIIQEKEYRWDRLRQFLSSKEGWNALIIGRPWLVFRLSNLKRPKVTARVLVVAVIFFKLWLISLSLGTLWINEKIQNYQSFESRVVVLALIAVWWFLTWWLIPFLIGLATVPTWLISDVVTRWRLRQAANLISRHQPLIIGITGSYGKTSTRHILYHLLGDKNQVWTPADSHNTRLSIATDMIANYQGQPIVVLEYGAYTQSEISKLTKYFPPQMTIITGLTYQHGGLFGSLEKIVQAKSELISALPEKSVVYWNGECPDVEKIVEVGLQAHHRLHDKPQVEVNRVDPAVVEMSSISISNHGRMQFQLAQQSIQMSVVGKHYAENIALAIAVARDQGVPTSRIVARLQSFQPNRYFTRVWQSQRGVLVIDDGGSCNPAGFAKILELAEEIEGSTKLLITSGIVDLGVESSSIHRELASNSNSIFDQVLYTGEAGCQEFVSVLGNKVLTDQLKIIDKLELLDQGTLLIIEGRLPGWVTEYVPKYTDS